MCGLNAKIDVEADYPDTVKRVFSYFFTGFLAYGLHVAEMFGVPRTRISLNPRIVKGPLWLVIKSHGSPETE